MHLHRVKSFDFDGDLSFGVTLSTECVCVVCVYISM